ncbi:18519_t:CDS:10 [Racocetra fulgida]|uniref:18519_t:CDS:1 n=1 Tax=Racocetra fulgida TaxID=60492 RepID=A0A9N8VKH8_9GLOM|nr:18519_t:CDS:10 [Racocetra fulgida]
MDIDVTKYHSRIELFENYENNNNEFIENTGNVQRRVLTPQEIAKTFRIMAYRKSERQARGRYRFASTYETRLVLIILGIVEAFTLLIWILIRYGYPKIVKDAYWLDTIWWWCIKQDDARGIEGDTVDENGLPHGLGEWVDDSFDGECLKGSGTGDAFHSVRVGLVKNRHTTWDEWRLFPNPYQSGIDSSVASVECSVSGKYLKYLPRATMIIPPKFEDPSQDDNESYISPIEYCLGCLKTFASAMGPDFAVKEHSSVIIRLSDNGLAITGYFPVSSTTSKDEVVIRRVPIKDKLDSSKTDYVIEIDDWRPSGQFLALADLPNYIKPFVFSPPGANSLWYFGSKKMGSSEDAVNDFRTFLQRLCNAGFCNVHIMAHSMGCAHALEYLKIFDGLFQTFQTVASSNNDNNNPKAKNLLMKLSTFTLLNPDASYNTFVKKDYARLINYCNHITIYSNSRDLPLKIGEYLGNDKSLGLHTSDLYYNNKLMDLDLIDTTQLDVNIHKMRHNFFNLNRLLVDDLSDIIVFGRRAGERKTRLSRKYVGHRAGLLAGSEHVIELSVLPPKCRTAASSQEQAMSKNIQISLAIKLQELSTSFRKQQSAYMKIRSTGLFSIESRDLDEEQDFGFTNDQLTLVESSEAMISQREHEINEIAKSIQTIAEIFNELQALVIDQGTLLDRIDYNVEQMN